MLSTWPDAGFFPHRWDVLRWGAAITLMWASIEKFAYPEWSYPILERMPFLTLGLSKSDFMILAGLAEFALAFALVWTPLACRLSALVLGVLFTAAIVPFGKIDAIGHLMIILILIGIVANDRQFLPRFKPIETLIILKSVSLVGFTATFYGLQTIFFGNLAADNESGPFDGGFEPTGVEHHVTSKNSTLRIDAAYPDPVLKVSNGRDGEGHWWLFLETENFLISEAYTLTTGNVLVGHIHIHRGKQKIASAYAPVIELNMLEPGRHDLDLTLYSTDHRLLIGKNGRVSKRVVLEVLEP